MKCKSSFSWIVKIGSLIGLSALSFVSPQFVYADAATNFVLEKTTFVANEQIKLLLGALTPDQSDNIVVASNIFVVPTGTLVPGAFLPDLDPSTVPNVI